MAVMPVAENYPAVPSVAASGVVSDPLPDPVRYQEVAVEGQNLAVVAALRRTLQAAYLAVAGIHPVEVMVVRRKIQAAHSPAAAAEEVVVADIHRKFVGKPHHKRVLRPAVVFEGHTAGNSLVPAAAAAGKDKGNSPDLVEAAAVAAAERPVVAGLLFFRGRRFFLHSALW